MDGLLLSNRSNILNNQRYCKDGKIPYRQFSIPKSDGSRRFIYEPSSLLKKVQQGINKFILSEIPQHPNVFGFSGSPNGERTVIGALIPRLKSKTIMTLDIKDAFLTTDRKKVELALKELPFIRAQDNDIARIITDIAVLPRLAKYADISVLPQGAPTSPRIFDLVFREIDKKLSRLALNVNGVYTRYADNLLFSMQTEKIPEKIQRAVIRTITRKEYAAHKIKLKSMKETMRILGLNIINGELHNTRKFKRNIRLTLHLEQKNIGKIRRQARRILVGQKSWAIIETLPQKLRDQLEVEKTAKGRQLTLSA